MVPALGFLDFELNLARFANTTYLFNIVFLGLGASALCFVTWNLAVRELGAVKASVYIYMVPVITVITSAIVLQEKITLLVALGTILDNDRPVYFRIPPEEKNKVRRQTNTP